MTYEKDIPDFALVPAKQPEERVRIPITQGAVYSPVQVTNIIERSHTTILVEEDLLVPDTRPDLKEILHITGKVRLASRELGPFAKSEDTIPLAGEIDLQTLYIPEKASVCGPAVATTSHISFREQWHTTVSEGSILTLDPQIENIDCMVINERKYRLKIRIGIAVRECRDQKIEIFEGLTSEEIHTLRTTVEMTSIPLRKKDIFTVQENLECKDGMQLPETILMQEISVVENYKQATAEKIVINGFIYINLLCSAPSPAASDSADPEMQTAEHPPACTLHQMQERIEFTQFIPLSQGTQWSGCGITFDGSDLRVKLVTDESESQFLRLEGDIITWAELYRNVEKEIIIDAYHRKKDFVCEFKELECRTLTGTATGECTVREITALEGPHGDVDRILHISGTLSGGESHAEPGKIITEGILHARLLCLGADGCIFPISQELPFRCITAAPYLQGGEIIRHKLYMKDLWAEKINSKQAELNGSILVCTEIMRPSPLRILKNPAFEELQGHSRESKPMVVYIVKETDTLWSIAKRFQSATDSIRQINQLEDSQLQLGQKLLILQ